jgi:hypothetical protein
VCQVELYPNRASGTGLQGVQLKSLFGGRSTLEEKHPLEPAGALNSAKTKKFHCRGNRTNGGKTPAGARLYIQLVIASIYYPSFSVSCIRRAEDTLRRPKFDMGRRN